MQYRFQAHHKEDHPCILKVEVTEKDFGELFRMKLLQVGYEGGEAQCLSDASDGFGSATDQSGQQGLESSVLDKYAVLGGAEGDSADIPQRLPGVFFHLLCGYRFIMQLLKIFLVFVVGAGQPSVQ